MAKKTKREKRATRVETNEAFSPRSPRAEGYDYKYPTDTHLELAYAEGYLVDSHLELVYEMRKRRGLSMHRTVTLVLNAIERRIARVTVHRSAPPKEFTRRTRNRPSSRDYDKDQTIESSDLSKRRTNFARQDTNVSDICVLPSTIERRAQSKEKKKVSPFKEDGRMTGRIWKKTNDTGDLFKDDMTVEYDVSLVGSSPPPSGVHHGTSQGTHQQSEKTLNVSEFDETLKSDSRRCDEQHSAKKKEAIRVKLRKKKELERHEQRRSGKQQFATFERRKIPQSIDLNVTTGEQTFPKDDILVWNQHTFEKLAFSLSATELLLKTLNHSKSQYVSDRHDIKRKGNSFAGAST